MPVQCGEDGREVASRARWLVEQLEIGEETHKFELGMRGCRIDIDDAFEYQY